MSRRAKATKAKGTSAVRRKSTKGEATRRRDLAKRLAEALEQQAATAEILRVISSSPTNVQPVFDAIVASAARLCDAEFSAVARFDDGLPHLVAINNMVPGETEAYHSLFPRPPHRGFIIGRAFVDSQPVHVEDVLADPDYDPRTLEVLQKAAPYRTYLGIPIIRNGVPIGAIGCGRREVKPFTETQIELVKTFADQAVIAIENVRLFQELQEKDRALTQAHSQVSEALELQTATAEILRVISGSPTDLGPVAQAIADSAGRLCDCTFSAVFRFDGELMHWVAARGTSGEQEDALRSVWPRPPGRDTLTGRTILGRETLHLHDAASDPSYTAARAALAIRSFLGVPMLREGQPIGVIGLIRSEVRPFSAREIALVQTFADQAVIAIENVRLFTELEARDRALTEALDQQTATGEILRVISSSPTAMRGQAEAGIGKVRQVLTSQLEVSQMAIVQLSILAQQVAEVYGAGGQAGEGLRLLAEALAVVDKTGEHSSAAELHRLKGVLLLAQSSDNTAEAEASFHQALAIARRQQARWWELRAAMSLSRLWQQQGKRADARQLLAEIYRGFTEGFDTGDLQDAKALMDALAS